MVIVKLVLSRLLTAHLLHIAMRIAIQMNKNIKKKIISNDTAVRPSVWYMMFDALAECIRISNCYFVNKNFVTSLIGILPIFSGFAMILLCAIKINIYFFLFRFVVGIFATAATASNKNETKEKLLFISCVCQW